MLSEEEIARIYESRKNPGSAQGSITLRGYSLEIEKLNQILDSLNLLRVTIRSALGSKNAGSEFKPAERPKTALEKKIDALVEAYEKKDQASTMAEFGF